MSWREDLKPIDSNAPPPPTLVALILSPRVLVSDWIEATQLILTSAVFPESCRGKSKF